VLIPLSAAFLKTFTLTLAAVPGRHHHARVLASYRLTFGASFLAALLNAVFGLVVAWVLVRYTFPAKRMIDALVDLPFALPTAVAGIALTAIYAENGWIGSGCPQGELHAAGVWVALVFIGCRSSCAPCSRCWRTSTGNWRKPPRRWAPPAGRPSGR